MEMRVMRMRNMTRDIVRGLAVGLCCGTGAGLLGQAFDSGSDGSYGPINVTANTTLNLPPDGIFHATTINIAPNTTLTFNRNALNTPVYLLATGDITIDGDINVDGSQGSQTVGGLGGVGGFDGGNPASVSTPPGSGYGPGAGGGGAPGNTASSAAPGIYSSTVNVASTNQGSPYGSPLLIPLAGGSGGGGTTGNPGNGGGGGGGAILLASNTRITFGSASAEIFARGGAYLATGNYNAGSGGAIRLVAPVVVANSARLWVTGGQNYGGQAGAGRIRIDALDRSQLGFNFQPAGVTSIGSLMLVFPTPLPRLDIVSAAGTSVPLNSGPVLVNLPFGSSPDQTVRVRAADFNDVVPIRVVLTPDHGDPVQYETQINNQVANPAEVTVNVTLPVNVQTRIGVWTR